jgi:signal transduction histidine kinase
VFPHETADRFVEAIRKTLESGETNQLEYDLTVENETYWFLANLTRLDEDKVFWVARDITERKKSEEAIRRRNEYLAVSAEIGKLVTSTLDLNTIFARTVNLINERFRFYHAGIFIVEETGFNAVLREATGAAGREMKDRKHTLQVNDKSIVGKVTMDGQAVVVNDVKTNLMHRPNPLLPETRAEAALPLRIGTRIIGAIDIQSKTANAFTEDDIAVLQILADQVAVAIDNARSFELSQEAVMEMRELDRMKSQFLANMSHELRTPLNSIIGFSRVIIKGIDGPVTELQQQDLTAIYNSGQHLLGLINDVLDLSKIEAGELQVSSEVFDLRALVEQVISTVRPLANKRGLTLVAELDLTLGEITSDRRRVEQILLNLLGNAIKFTDTGVVTLVGEVDQEEHARLSVRDTGIGIKPEDLRGLFQPFRQVDTGLARNHEGTGLGLAICRRLADLLGGDIQAESEYGVGSTFTLILSKKGGSSRAGEDTVD